MSTDDTINATVRAMAAARGMKLYDVAGGIEMAPATFDRRLAKGGWSADEAAQLAALFGLTVDQLMTGIGGTLTE